MQAAHAVDFGMKPVVLASADLNCDDRQHPGLVSPEAAFKQVLIDKHASERVCSRG